jgi:hypothetical protein
MAKRIEFTEVTLRKQVTIRGGGIEIDLTRFGFKNQKMSAYQNYLGGGILGRICVNDTIRANHIEVSEKQTIKLDKLGERLKKYFHSLTSQSDEFDRGYEFNQKQPISAY